MAGLGLFLFTSALGRVWCGYACPQTVWTDLMILVERWVEGDRNARVRLWKRQVGSAQVAAAADQMDALGADRPGDRRRLGVLLHRCADAGGEPGHRRRASGRLYHHRGDDRDHRAVRRLRPRAGLHLHVPLAAHPGGDDGRGHADRRLSRLAGRAARQAPQGRAAEALGDCIDCMACVNVCPMGIDIRDGQQLACITCALCIDACDDVMAKIGKPRGLIDYIALKDEAEERGRRAADADLAPCAAAADASSTPRSGPRSGFGLVFALFIRPGHRLHRRPGPQPDLRHAVGRLDPQHLRYPHPQQARRRTAVPDRR